MKIILPPPLIETRKFLCRNCTADHDFEDACASCPNNNWGPMLCSDAPIYTPPKKHPPELKNMAKSAINSFKEWAKKGFKKTEEREFNRRLDLCKKCEFWNSRSFNNTGRCMKCGCSTWAKLRLATEKCPIGKW